MRWKPTTAIAHPGVFDLDHSGAKAPEDLHTIWASEELGEIEHPDTA
jgi:hypothetical protein